MTIACPARLDWVNAWIMASEGKSKSVVTACMLNVLVRNICCHTLLRNGKVSAVSIFLDKPDYNPNLALTT